MNRTGTLRHSRTHRQALAERWAIEAVVSGPRMSCRNDIRDGDYSPYPPVRVADFHLKQYFRSHGACVRHIEALTFDDRVRASLCFFPGRALHVPAGWRVESQRRVLARFSNMGVERLHVASAEQSEIDRLQRRLMRRETDRMLDWSRS